MGGIGKTTLATKLAEQVQDQFEFLIWRSLLNAPTLTELLDDLLKFLSDQQMTDLPETIAAKFSKLMEYLRQHRCLVVLDNMETLLAGRNLHGTVLGDYRGYSELLRRVGEISHKSCFLVTSREEPDEVAMLSGETLPVRSLLLNGLKTGATELLISKGLSGTDTKYQQLIDQYGGNPLAIKIVSTTVQDLFGGNIKRFLEAGISSFNSIRLLLSQQFDRLTETEMVILYWLTINREKVSLLELETDIYPPLPKQQLLEALESLLKRSLIEQSLLGFTQQPVIMESVAERLVEKVCEELAGDAGVRGQGSGEEGVTEYSVQGTGRQSNYPLPITDSPTQNSKFKIQNSDPTPHSPLSTSPSHPRILLAEDNEANIQVMTQYLEAQGYEIFLAKNGAEAIEATRIQKPDLVLMDVQMPEMDGLEATRRIRADEAIADTPIIAVTSFAMESDREEIVAAGVNSYRQSLSG